MLKEQAFAKINIHLNVVEQRSDSYHNIESIMFSTAYGDKLSLEVCQRKKVNCGSFDLVVTGKYASVLDALPVEENLVYKAYQRFFENVPFSAVIKVKLVKNIPSGAGLGGGSSDAAAMLRMLNKIFKLYTFNRLCRMAREIGADVPFCLQVKPALCSGVGEQIKRFNNKNNLSVVIVINQFSISTADAYAHVEKSHSYLFNRNSVRHYLEHKRHSKLFNSFEFYAISRYPEIAKIKSLLMEHGAFFSLMSGSGSSVVGYYNNIYDAKRASVKMEKNGYSAVATYVI